MHCWWRKSPMKYHYRVLYFYSKWVFMLLNFYLNTIIFFATIKELSCFKYCCIASRNVCSEGLLCFHDVPDIPIVMHTDLTWPLWVLLNILSPVTFWPQNTKTEMLPDASKQPLGIAEDAPRGRSRNRQMLCSQWGVKHHHSRGPGDWPGSEGGSDLLKNFFVSLWLEGKKQLQWIMIWFLQV